MHAHFFSSRYIGPGDFLLNLSVCIGSLSLVEYCQSKGILYQDASLEAWGNDFIDPNLTPEERSNYKIRQGLLDLREKLHSVKGCTTAGFLFYSFHVINCTSRLPWC